MQASGLLNPTSGSKSLRLVITTKEKSLPQAQKLLRFLLMVEITNAEQLSLFTIILLKKCNEKKKGTPNVSSQ